ncbi:ABC transporter permease [Methanococcus aeolicus]|uniref:ABC transporter permease n=1 Tax=Methanococcus aeolicus TaxID=42879 RepID=UPI0021C85BD9|nr:iron export ABC transporter permease subunit FetB [Methanococcus aeolicus]UXM84951.1 iron export ABC transporter permease subunit FetB [Methanococcus aeolicus]
MFENLIYSFSFVLLALALAFKEKLGIEKELIYTSILALIQLFILGYILITIFSYGMITAYLLMMVMIIAASFMVYKKIKIPNKKKLFLNLFITFLGTAIISLLILVFSTVVPYEPQYLIPLMGMVIGNSLNTAHLTLDKIIDEVKSRKDELWGYVALGATDFQATKPFIKSGVNSAIIPQMNKTKTVGIIFIPGAMTGMIIGGADPIYAATIQIVIMWMILSGAVASGLLICYLSYKDFVKL